MRRFVILVIVAAASALLLPFGRAEQVPHWAYVAPQRSPLPRVSNETWTRNPIDRFVLARLDAEGLSPVREADRAALIRRVTFQLTGLPPTPAEVDAFERDAAPDAYERLVDRLLASPHYGERMATPWLDAARYADTHGYHADSHRDMWAWRDWVIRALNRNLPFDQFTIEQLAGDLLPNATLEQRLASGFHRNTLMNFEQGAIPEEYLAEYVADRVITTGAVWLGQTFECARCHDHKYDPFTQRDFYGLYAYFHNIAEQGLDGRTGNAAPLLAVPTSEQRVRMAELEREIAEWNARSARRRDELAAKPAVWLAKLNEQQGAQAPPADALLYCPLDQESGKEVVNEQDAVAGHVAGEAQWLKAGKFGGALLLDGATQIEFSTLASWDREDPFTVALWVFPTTRDAMTIAACRGDDRVARGWEIGLEEGRVFVRLTHDADQNTLAVRATSPLALRRWQHLVVTYDGSSRASGVQYFYNGQPQLLETQSDALTASIAATVPLRIGGRADTNFRGMLDELRIYLRRLEPADAARLAGADPLSALLAIPAAQRTPEQDALLLAQYLQQHDAEYAGWQQAVRDAERAQRELERAVPTVMVMQERTTPRDTYVLERGDYRSPGERVEPALPTALAPANRDLPRNRLGLAQWLVAPDNPLTARVTVNRLWQQCWGTGLVATAEDFGTRGEAPSHPELLDWLACEFMESGWNVKHVLRMIVTSAAYQQSSHAGPDSFERDPDNRLLARGPRQRLPAEMIRDGALAASGLLVHRPGGPGVFPYQPPGLWEELAYNPEEFTAQVYVQSHGADLYRRSVYMFWKRTSPPPGLSLFDAPNRETCQLRRMTTHTPLQALVLMNDPTYVEAARALAVRVLSEAHANDGARVTAMFRRLLARRPRPNELTALLDGLAVMHTHFANAPDAARSLLEVGEHRAPPELPASELAAWTALASTLLNLDETMTPP